MATSPSAAALADLLQRGDQQQEKHQNASTSIKQQSARAGNVSDGKPRSALASPSLGGTSKAVSIAEPESNSPHIPGRLKEHDLDLDNHISLGPHALRSIKSRKHKVHLGRSGARPPTESTQHRHRTPADLLQLQSSPDKHVKSAHSSKADHDSVALGTMAMHASTDNEPAKEQDDVIEKRSKKLKRALPKGHITYHDLVKWVQKEKSRRAASKARRKEEKVRVKSEQKANETGLSDKLAAASLTAEPESYDHLKPDYSRRSSDSSNASSEGSAALEMLQDILERNANMFANPHANRSAHSLRGAGSIRKLRRGSTAASSDTEFFDAEFSVPSCNVFLDNSRALSSANDVPSPGGTRPHLPRSLSNKEKDSWREFKFEIVRLTHTLKIKGWRRVPMDNSDGITVERLSGALTNSVYVVTPPAENAEDSQSESDAARIHRRARPRKLLLRIYGLQVEHLIDREAELAILRRLARKRIGPRMLGTFRNGRFEEHFDARPLTANDLHKPDCSRQIAKRFRELHDGIELLHEEVEAGPFVFQNIDKWMRRCERIVRWIDENRKDDLHPLAKGHIIGADFDFFKEALQRYRVWLEEQYNGWIAVGERLVFAHNDAQYGNILRLHHADRSKIKPEDEHKQLIVIDFEYANANVPGLEFANHFTEWCYNYHDPEAPYLCKVPKYPNYDEQTNFFSSYVSHRPSFAPAQGTLSHRASTTSLQSLSNSVPATPNSMHPSAPAIGMVSSFMLEARSQPQPLQQSNSAPPSAALPGSGSMGNDSTQTAHIDEDLHAEAKKREIERLRWETRAWRGVNSAQWAMWGIVQANVPGMPAFDDIASPYLAARDEKVDEEDSDTEMTPKVKQQEFAPQIELDQASETKVAKEEEEEDEGFDYLKYAFERARFFWGDVLGLGILKPEEVSDDIKALARILEY